MKRKVLTPEEAGAKMRAKFAKLAEETIRRRPPIPDQKLASVEAYQFFINIYTEHLSGNSVIDPDSYDAFLDPACSNEELGRSARLALADSRMIDPTSEESDRLNEARRKNFERAEAAMMKRAGVKTFKAFYRGYTVATLREIHGQIEIKGHKPVTRRGYDGIPGHEARVVPADASDADLGAAIRAELAISAKYT
ncbi:contact-dependent growth inhibition system immunity protein [Pseudooctadecabacter jejudonensis]|uniref:Uncharacterized protein n=1 Tax=Pseudooctadecabacter jejudonensis TaxID=1391910 RepID=A0A1Y5T933_9RHOB|nr:contact-dependent growth inhibition system immunity protein [Pseudooctadecabacter jejudonensis]SLN56766.1 hypothetical protein PSJ8397_03017 [Pseudooctadecabacter jejudonensis]